jgi:hypothetical protein
MRLAAINVTTPLAQLKRRRGYRDLLYRISAEKTTLQKSHPKPARPLPDPQKVFTQGRRFMAAEERIRSQDTNDPAPEILIKWLALPANVNSAFACELFLEIVAPP